MKEEKPRCCECDKELDAANRDDFYNEICRECLESLPSQSDYCSVNCRISGQCDGSC